MVSRIAVGLSNLVTRLRRTRVRAEELLILIPRCLQCSDCENNILRNLAACKRCGKCKVKDLIEMAQKHGCRIAAAAGGELALARVKSPEVKAVVAVACEKELRVGAQAAFPKAVIGVINTRPKGPCFDTDVDLGEVEKAIEWLLRP
jgi:hypothetical protein